MVAAVGGAGVVEGGTGGGGVLGGELVAEGEVLRVWRYGAGSGTRGAVWVVLGREVGTV